MVEEKHRKGDDIPFGDTVRSKQILFPRGFPLVGHKKLSNIESLLKLNYSLKIFNYFIVGEPPSLSDLITVQVSSDFS